MEKLSNYKFNKKTLAFNLLFSMCIIIFFFSEYQIAISFVNNIFQYLESIKLKYIIALICCIIFMLDCKLKNDDYSKEFKRFIFMIVILFIISLFFQLLNGFHIELINETLYLITPLLLSYSIIKHENGNVGHAINIIFYVLVILFILKYFPTFSIKSIFSIDFINSYSPYESGLAFYSVLLFVYYSYSNDKIKTIISFIICFVSFKRLTFVFLFLFLIFKKKLPRIKLNYKILIIFFVLIPMALVFFCNDSVSAFFYNHTGININTFMKGRFDFIRLLSNSDQIKYGLGSARKYLSEYYINYYKSLGHSNIAQYYDPHCDLLRFYLECGFLGLFTIVYTFFKNASKSNVSLFIILYIFTEAIFNHIFGAGNTVYWTLLYMIIYYFNYNYSKKMSGEKDENTYS